MCVCVCVCVRVCIYIYIYIHIYMLYITYIYIYIYIYIQWCEKVLAPFLIFYFFACLPHFNVSDHQTNLNINQR